MNDKETQLPLPDFHSLLISCLATRALSGRCHRHVSLFPCVLMSLSPTCFQVSPCPHITMMPPYCHCLHISVISLCPHDVLTSPRCPCITVMSPLSMSPLASHLSVSPDVTFLGPQGISLSPWCRTGLERTLAYLHGQILDTGTASSLGGPGRQKAGPRCSIWWLWSLVPLGSQHSMPVPFHPRLLPIPWSRGMNCLQTRLRLCQGTLANPGTFGKLFKS